MSNPFAEYNRRKSRERLEYYELHRPLLEQWIEEGASYRTIVTKLNSNGFTNLSGSPWSLASLHRCLKALDLKTKAMEETE